MKKWNKTSELMNILKYLIKFYATASWIYLNFTPLSTYQSIQRTSIKKYLSLIWIKLSSIVRQ